jgi:two-component system sensor histidine kinase KdpD
LWGALPLVLATIVCFATRDLLTLADQAMIYLLGVLVASSRLSRGPSLVVAFLSILALDFFFVPPLYQFAVAQAHHLVTFAVMLLVAVAVSRRTVRMREQADSARERERRTAALFGMSRELSAEDEPVSIAESAIRHVHNLFDCDAAVFLRGDQGLERLAGDASGVLSSERELAVGRWVFDHGRPAGSGTDTLPASRALFLPLAGSRGILGVFGIDLSTRAEDLSPSQHQILETFVAQTALALERVHLGREASQARIAAETEALRSSLLSAVSHDLRTPLASITGSAQAMLDDRGRLTQESRRELLENIREEGDRLGRLVANLLDLTRLESGTIEIKREWCPVDEIVHSAIGRLSSLLEGRSVAVDLPDDVLLVPVDPVLVEQALVNLIENAAKYSDAGSPIEVSAEAGEFSVVFEVSDRGRGIPPGQERKIFEKFYRVGDGSREGAGLGLAVVHAIVKAHDGSITAENRTGGGATFRFHLPVLGGPPSGDGLERATVR